MMVVVGLLVSFLSGCGNQPYTTLPVGMNAMGTQGCTIGTQWNPATSMCTPAAIPPQNTIYPTQVYPTQNIVPTTVPATPATMASSACPAGQYFNGVTCSVTLNNNAQATSPCSQGQLNTQNFGCAFKATQCDHQYAYDGVHGPRCLPASVIVPARCNTAPAVRANPCGGGSGSDGCSASHSSPRGDRRELRREQREERRDARLNAREARREARAQKKACKREAKEERRELKRQYKEDRRNAGRNRCCTISN